MTLVENWAGKILARHRQAMHDWQNGLKSKEVGCAAGSEKYRRKMNDAFRYHNREIRKWTRLLSESRPVRPFSTSGD